MEASNLILTSIGERSKRERKPSRKENLTRKKEEECSMR